MDEARDHKNATSWLILIILLGFGIRLTGLIWGQGYSYFTCADSLSAYSTTVDYACGDPKAQYLSQANFSPHAKLPGSLWSVFCFFGLRFWGSVDGIILLVILINTATIPLVYLLAKRTLGTETALWAALLSATLPFPVFYSVIAYNPDVMPFLGALLFLAVWEVARHPHSRCIMWVVFLFLIGPQFHMSIFVVLPAVVIILFLARAQLNIPWLIGGLVAGLFFYVPYLRGEMAHGWENTLGVGSGRPGHWWGGLKALTAPWNLLINYVPQWTRTTREYQQLGKACFGSFGIFVTLNLLSVLVAMFLIAGAFTQIRTALRGLWRLPREAFQQSPGLLLLGILLVVPLLASLLSTQSFHSRYCIILLPALLSLAGSAVVKWRADHRISRLFIPAMAVMTAANVWFMPAMYHFQGKSIDQGPVFFSSFRNLENVYQHLKGHAGPHHSIQVDDAAYLKTFSPQDIRAEAKLIRRYVAIREKEALALSGIQTAPVIYTLSTAGGASPGDAAIAYLSHGIALSTKPSSPQEQN